MSQPARRVGDLLAASGHKPAGVRACRRGGHLLPEHRAHRELGGVDGARNPAARGLVHEWREQRVAAKQIADGRRVGVEVEQAPAAADRDRQIPQIG